jgi:hypothetical protein
MKPKAYKFDDINVSTVRSLEATNAEEGVATITMQIFKSAIKYKEYI